MFNKSHTASERLAIWREVRQTALHTQNLDYVLSRFADLHPRPRYLDYYTPDSWPTVFDIVSEGLLCQSGITLVLAGTLHYAQLINGDELTFDAISNHTTGKEGLVLRYQNHLYNFLPGSRVHIDQAWPNLTCYDTHNITIDKLFRTLDK